MFYRKKIILALLQIFEGQLDKIRFQKLLFLFAQKQQGATHNDSKGVYDFIPYRYGCYSYSANADIKAMASKDLITEYENTIFKKDPTDYLKQLKPADLKLLQEVKKHYGEMSTNDLIKYTYIHFPFYAIKSEIAENILGREELEKVTKAKPKSNQSVLFTIGYEGISLEEYLVRLLKNDVKILVDVRNNPLSMKYGFSKSQLKKYCSGVGIDYVHLPEVGIKGEQRRELNTQADYNKLFDIYRKVNLTQTIVYQKKILNLLEQYKRIALTCFESDINRCHRKHLAEAIQRLSDFKYEIKHI